MRQTRSSARLTKTAKPDPDKEATSSSTTKRKTLSSRVKNEENTATNDSDFEDTKDEDEDFEEEEETAPKRKRARTTKATKAAPRKRQVRGKQGRLEGLMKMPVDIFTEIALYLMPKDIITLSRSNKFFHNLLMNRTAIHIWHGTMRNVPGLPPCPPDMSEPHFLALIYARNCSMCGATVSRRMDELLRVRLCPACRDTSLISMRTVPPEVQIFVLCSDTIVPNKRRWGYEAHALKSDVEEVQTRLAELKEAGNQGELDKWKQARRAEIDTLRKQAVELGRFLDGIDQDRGTELMGLKRERRLEIHRRLIEIGWEKEDLKFPFYRSRPWDALVEQPKPLTDRTWENLRPKLIPLLEANREDRLQRETAERLRSRRDRLNGYLLEIKEEMDPILDVTIRVPVLPSSGATPSNTTSSNATSSSSTPASVTPATTSASGASSSNAEPATAHIKHIGVFPDIVDALEWETMQSLLEEDLPVEDMCERVDMVLPEITGEANGWIDEVETHLADLLRDGREEDGLDSDVPDLTLPVVGDSTTDPLEDITVNQKLLLRADSLFVSNKSTGRHVPVVYDALVASGYSYTHAHDTLHILRCSKAPLDLSKFKRHVGAQAAARKLLESVDKPDATFLEMRSAGQNYMCGRCHDLTPHTWEEMVQHYVVHQEVWENAQKPQGELTRLGITFRNVHDPEFETDKPMMKILSKEELVATASGLSMSGNMKACHVCSKSGLLLPVRGNEERILEHLRDVHDISEPKVPEHYGAAFFGGFIGNIFGHDDFYDYDDDDSDMWDDPFDLFGGGMYSDDDPWGW
ncbi:hypothetical protein FRC08_009194 [Ceratobasidium sp. 394]|nr:hypothetical protein FRC08_009194 [Ceratobasidium sp. 394]